MGFGVLGFFFRSFGWVFEGFLRFSGGFGGFPGFQGEHHHRYDYFSKASGSINLRCFLR